jgi:hypothetical protein
LVYLPALYQFKHRHVVRERPCRAEYSYPACWRGKEGRREKGEGGEGREWRGGRGEGEEERGERGGRGERGEGDGEGRVNGEGEGEGEEREREREREIGERYTPAITKNWSEKGKANSSPFSFPSFPSPSVLGCTLGVVLVLTVVEFNPEMSPAEGPPLPPPTLPSTLSILPPMGGEAKGEVKVEPPGRGEEGEEKTMGEAVMVEYSMRHW